MEARDFEQIYEQHAATIAAYALRRTRSEADAEEIVAETFMIAWRRHGELRGDPLPWLYGVARRVAASNARRAGRAPIELREDIAAPADASLERAELLHALLRLPERERDALLLTVWEGLDQRACGQALGCSRVAVALRLRRARARLRAHQDAGERAIPHLLPTEAP
jgi:RNA polymerase sigma-70 factor (ECF subfamily)